MATTTHKEPAMNAHFEILSFDSDCGRWTVAKRAGGWFLVNRETEEREFLSADTQEALDIANERIAA